jgi:hypothetical protein
MAFQSKIKTSVMAKMYYVQIIYINQRIIFIFRYFWVWNNFTNSALISHSIHITKATRLMLLREVISAYCDIKHTNKLWKVQLFFFILKPVVHKVTILIYGVKWWTKHTDIDAVCAPSPMLSVPDRLPCISECCRKIIYNRPHITYRSYRVNNENFFSVLIRKREA